ncbi:MAG TPA: maleylpyruvate isomerase N-terminal domain-containing protein [Vicinamibacterales bacterium]
MERLPPIYVAELIRPLLAELITLLRSLNADDWDRPTVAGAWRVRDVAAHVLDTTLRKVAAYRDGHLLAPDAPITSDADLAHFVNGLNAVGVSYSARLSAREITDLLEIAAGWAADLVEGLDPHARALWAVSWAGETGSENWMDTGRDYTEWWHHQAQIRDAVGAPRLLEPRWFLPLMEISVRVLPRVYAPVDAPPQTAVTLAVEGETNAEWSVVKGDTAWQVFSGAPANPDARIRIDADDAWRLFYNALSKEQAESRAKIEGDPRIAAPLIRARAVIL